MLRWATGTKLVPRSDTQVLGAGNMRHTVTDNAFVSGEEFIGSAFCKQHTTPSSGLVSASERTPHLKAFTGAHVTKVGPLTNPDAVMLLDASSLCWGVIATLLYQKLQQLCTSKFVGTTASKWRGVPGRTGPNPADKSLMIRRNQAKFLQRQQHPMSHNHCVKTSPFE